MSELLDNVSITSLWGVGLLLLVWIVLFKFAHLLVVLLRHEPLVGWGISPLGITIMFVHEPSILFIWLNVLFPALVSAAVLYVGLFTAISPVELPHDPLVQFVVITCGVLISSLVDFMRALHDVRHPLWGEARVLRSIRQLQSTWSTIHFTPFGYSYLKDHFRASPHELLSAL